MSEMQGIEITADQQKRWNTDVFITQVIVEALEAHLDEQRLTPTTPMYWEHEDWIATVAQVKAMFQGYLYDEVDEDTQTHVREMLLRLSEIYTGLWT